jgi:hypothetical protein
MPPVSSDDKKEKAITTHANARGNEMTATSVFSSIACATNNHGKSNMHDTRKNKKSPKLPFEKYVQCLSYCFP